MREGVADAAARKGFAAAGVGQAVEGFRHALTGRAAASA
jgi:hypothetical protein